MKIEWLEGPRMRLPRFRPAKVDVEISVGLESRRLRMSRTEADRTAQNLERIAKPSGTRVVITYAGRHVSGYVTEREASKIRQLIGAIAQRVVITVDGRTRYDQKMRPDDADQIIEYARTRA